MSPVLFVSSVLSRALSNLVSQRRLHVLALSVMALSLSVLGVFVVVTSNLATVRDRLGDERNVTAFVGVAVDQAGQQRLQQEAQALPGVAGVELLDHQTAHQRFRAALGPHGAILDDLGDDVIPAALIVTAAPGTTPEGVERLAHSLEGLVGVEEVAYALEELRRLTALIRIVELAALAIGGLIVLVTIIVISNTIRLTVISRQEEIAILKLVGATDSYVRLPFVVEGLLVGGLSGTIALAIVWTLNQVLTQALAPAAGAFGALELATLSWTQAVLLVSMGALLGLVGGVVSVGRFLKVL